MSEILNGTFRINFATEFAIIGFAIPHQLFFQDYCIYMLLLVKMKTLRIFVYIDLYVYISVEWEHREKSHLTLSVPNFRRHLSSAF